MTLRKGLRLRRKSDGFVFEVKNTGCRGAGAFLQCVDATRIFGWFWKDAIELGFERV